MEDELREILNKRNRDLENRVMKMGFEEFKKIFIDFHKEFGETLIFLQNLIIDQLGDNNKKIKDDFGIVEDNFQQINDRLRALEEFTTVFSIRFMEVQRGKPMSFDKRKNIAEFLSIEWRQEEETIIKLFNEHLFHA